MKSAVAKDVVLKRRKNQPLRNKNGKYNNSGIKPGFTKINLTTPIESLDTDEV